MRLKSRVASLITFGKNQLREQNPEIDNIPHLSAWFRKVEADKCSCPYWIMEPFFSDICFWAWFLLYISPISNQNTSRNHPDFRNIVVKACKIILEIANFVGKPQMCKDLHSWRSERRTRPCWTVLCRFSSPQWWDSFSCTHAGVQQLRPIQFSPSGQF